MTRPKADKLLKDHSDPDPRLREMLDELPKFRAEIRPSKYWERLNSKNLRQLAESGYENFKRTVARNYFTFIVTPWNRQIRFLMRSLPFGQAIGIFVSALFAPRHQLFKWYQSIYYNLLTRLLWAYAVRNDPARLLSRLHEPEEGNPPRVYHRGRLISQDLANAFLEYRSMMNAGVDRDQIRTVMELGPGYGRTAYVHLTLRPGSRYVLVDIPPALFICEKYLSAVFKERRRFAFRAFSRYDEIRAEFEAAEIAFLMPHQLELLPAKSVDLFINISSFHEMRMDQIRYYFDIVGRLTRKYFYTKQWKETTIPYEEVVLRQADYPVDPSWRQIYARECKVQDLFFEALYDLS